MGRTKKEKESAVQTIGIGDIVYLRTDCDKKPRIIVSYEALPFGGYRFKLRSGDKTSKHYDFEIELAPESRKEVRGFLENKNEGSSNKQD